MDLHKMKVSLYLQVYLICKHNDFCVNFLQFKKEQQYQSYLEKHPELGAAIELFFETLCAEEAKHENSEMKSSRLGQMIDFFTSPELETLVADKLQIDSNKWCVLTLYTHEMLRMWHK